jgi:hypothetical protein
MSKMFCEEETLEIAAYGVVLHYLNNNKKKIRKKRLTKTRLINQLRIDKGFYTSTLLSMKEYDAQQFFKYTRMSIPLFNKFVDLLKPHIMVHKRHLPDSIYIEERIAITLQ